MIPRSAADRIATLAANATGTPVSMVGLVDGTDFVVTGGFGVDWSAIHPVPVAEALTGSVITDGRPLVIGDTLTDPRVPDDALIRRTPTRAYAAFPVQDQDRRPVGVCCVLDHRPREWTAAELAAVEDAAQVCALMVAERAARADADRQRRFLDAVLDNLHDGVTACDADGRIVLSNTRMHQIRSSGRTPTDLDDPALLAGVRQDDGSPMTKEKLPLARALRGETVRGEQFVIELAGHRRRRYQAAGGPIPGPDGRPVGAVVAVHEITRRRRGERFRTCELAVVRALSEATTVQDGAPRAMEAIVTALGWSHAELWLVEPEAEILRPAGVWSAPGPSGKIDVPPELPYGQGLAGRAWQAGKPLWIRDIGRPQSLISATAAEASQLHAALATPVRDARGIVGVLNVFADVAEDPEDELMALMSGIAAHIGHFLGQRMVADLERQLARSKDEYLALVGHELRTPLTSISAYTELLREADADSLAQDGPALIEVIERNTSQLRRIIDDLLELSALDTGHAPVQAAPFDLASVVREAAAATRAGLGPDSPLSVDVRAPAELVVPGDPYRLRQVVDNLLGNAVKYSPDGGRITVTLARTGAVATLSVADTGMGIAPAEREKMFSRLYRATEVREKAIPGTGLGLALSRAVVERHHGTITLEPHDGPGTTVTLRLPLHPR